VSHRSGAPRQASLPAEGPPKNAGRAGPNRSEGGLARSQERRPRAHASLPSTSNRRQSPGGQARAPRLCVGGGTGSRAAQHHRRDARAGLRPEARPGSPKFCPRPQIRGGSGPAALTRAATEVGNLATDLGSRIVAKSPHRPGAPEPMVDKVPPLTASRLPASFGGAHTGPGQFTQPFGHENRCRNDPRR